MAGQTGVSGGGYFLENSVMLEARHKFIGAGSFGIFDPHVPVCCSALAASFVDLEFHFE